MEHFVDINQVLRDSTCENLEQVLKLYSDNCVSHDNKTVVSHITNLLGTKKTVNEGLVYLAILLPRGSTEIIHENGMTWVVSCIRACENEDASVRNLAYLSLASLITIMSTLPDFLKSVSNNSIGKLMECIMKDPTLLTSLYCLEVCLKYLPGTCGNSKTNLEKYLLNFLQDQNKNKVILAAKCMHLLQQTGGGGSKGVNHKTNWERQFRMTINSLHSLMDVLYANVMETVARSNDELCLSMPPFSMPDDPAHQVLEVSKRFNNLCYFLQVMLTEPFPVAKRLQPDLVLHLINRGLVVTSKVLARVSTDNIILNAFLPEIHQSLLKTLDALLFCANEHMLSYAPIICKIILNVLQWTQDIVTPTHRIIRLSAYETLISWMKVSSLSSFIEQHASEIITAIMFDIAPRKSKVKLENMKSVNNEIKEEHRDVQELHSFYGTGESKEKLCCLALQCFRKVLSSSGIFMKPTMQKNLQTTIADLLLRLQNGQHNDTIYNKSVKCRKLLYQIFFSLVLHPSSRFPPPTHEAVIIFSQGQTDCDHDISDLCSEMLCTIKKIIQTNSLNRDENKGLVLNKQEEETADVTALPNDKFLVPPVEEPIVLDSTDLSASDAEMETKEVPSSSQESIETISNCDVVPNSQTSISSAEPVILTPVNNCTPMNGTTTNNDEHVEDDDGPLLVIPNDDEDTAMKVDEIPEVPIKRQKLAEDVVLPSCEEIVAAVKQNHDKKVDNNDVQEAKSEELVLENNSSFKIEKVETVSLTAFDESIPHHDSSAISEKLAENSVGNLSVEEMMSSFVSEINDDI